MPTFTNITVDSTTLFNGKYSFFLGPVYGWVYWDNVLNVWQNSSGPTPGFGVVYNYLPSTAALPTTSPSLQWINVVPGHEIFACFEGSCDDCKITGRLEFDCCFIGDITGYSNPNQCTTTTSTSTTTTTTAPCVGCNNYSVTISQTDLNDATGNTINTSLNGALVITYIDCSGTLSNDLFVDSGTIEGCACAITGLTYWKNNQEQEATGSSFSLIGPCPGGG